MSEQKKTVFTANPIIPEIWDVCVALYELVIIVLGVLMLIAGAIDGATNHDYAHGCFDLLVGALCLGWLKKR